MIVAIAMKMRHDSEKVFFDLMAEAGFNETALLEWPLPGDIEAGEEIVYMHVYRHDGEENLERYESDSERDKGCSCSSVERAKGCVTRIPGK